MSKELGLSTALINSVTWGDNKEDSCATGKKTKHKKDYMVLQYSHFPLSCWLFFFAYLQEYFFAFAHLFGAWVYLEVFMLFFSVLMHPVCVLCRICWRQQHISIPTIAVWGYFVPHTLITTKIEGVSFLLKPSTFLTPQVIMLPFCLNL